MFSPRNLGCFVLGVLAMVVTLSIWIRTPRELYAAPIDALAEESSRAFQQRQDLYAHDEEVNGYLNPVWKSLWAARRPGGPVISYGEAVLALGEFIELDPLFVSGAERTPQNLERHLKDVGKSPKDLARARSAFQEYLPELRSAITKPQFLVPNSTLDTNVATANFIGMRKTAQALSFEGWLLKREGKPGQGALLQLDSLLFGERSGKHGFIIQLMISMAVQNIGFESILASLQHDPLTDDELSQIEAGLEAALPAKNAYRAALQEELAGCRTKLREGCPDDLFPLPHPLLKSLWVGLGFHARECRILFNDLYPQLQATGDSAFPPLQLPAINCTFWSDLAGRGGYYTSLLHYDHTVGYNHFYVLRMKLLGARWLAGLRRYHLQHKTYPRSAAEVAPLPKNELSDKELIYRFEDGKLSLSVPVDPAVSHRLNTQSQSSKTWRFENGCFELIPASGILGE